MARTTYRARGTGIAHGVLAAALVVSLLALACFAATASARVAGAAAPASKNEAPKITEQPANVTVEEGETATFEAQASGVPTPSVQWEVLTSAITGWRLIAGARSDKLTIADTKTSESGYEYRAFFLNVAGAVTSKPATLTVQLRPAVTAQPDGLTVEEGQSAVFESTASGFPTPTVHWEVSSNGGGTWKSVAGATADRLTIADTKTSEDGDQYRAVFENAAGLAVSNAATLNVHKAPAVTRQPLSASVEEGQNAVFEASASGFPTPTVQWEVSTNAGSSWSPVAGATSDQLTVASTTTTENGYEFRAVFVNAAGSATSAAATLSVHKLPAVTTQPVGTTIEVGQNAVFEAAASGFPPPTVQWEVSTNAGVSWSPVGGATSDQLTVTDAQASESGDEYRAVFTNIAGKATSEAATLTVSVHHYRAVGWGQNTFGQLGDGSLLQSDVPVSPSVLNFVTAVAAGTRHSLALLADGTVAAWGDNASGQLGDGGNASSDEPVKVDRLTRVKAIAAGANFSLALLSDGTVMAWGGDESGQLGDGSTVEQDEPVEVEGLKDVTAISAGGEHGLALLSDGKVMAWGNDEHGELGDGNTSNRDKPANVTGLTKVTAISAGGEHSLALLSDGTVMAWGADENGQLGNSTVKEHGEEEERISEVPVPVMGVSEATAISAGARFSLALLASRTVMAWGADEAGQLGDGIVGGNEEVPGPVSGLSEVAAVSAGGAHSMALLDNSTVATWGEDKAGELGNGTSGEPSDVPVPVSGLGQASGIAAGGSHDLAYSEPLPSVSGLSPAVGGVAGGTHVTITGVNLEGATAVAFGSNAAERFTVNSPTSISAVSPPGSLGTVNVTVTTPAGTSATGPATRFTYVPAPTIQKLSSKGGPGSGGTTVTITGTNLEEVTSVAFGASAAKEFTVSSATTIVAVSPPGAGAVNVTATAPGGTSATSKHTVFSYTPAVESVAPNIGPAGGDTSVTITGSGFAVGAGATTFKFGSKKATAVECSSTASCTLLTPAGKAGTVEVTAAVGKLKSADDPPGDQFTYE